MAPSPLKTLFWNITYACNYRCGVCFTASGARKNGELTTGECMDVVENAHSAGIDDIVISGGEPFMRKDLGDVLCRMAELGMAARIASNGTLLTEKILDRLKRDTLTRSFQISLDTVDEGLYDTFHQSPEGSQRAALDALALIRERGFHTTVSVRLTPETLDGIPGLLDLASEKGWATVTVHWPLHAGRSDGVFPQDADVLTLLSPAFEHFFALPRHWLIETYIPWAQYHPVVRRLRNRGKWAHLGCSAGRRLLAINPTGMISPCVCMDAPQTYIGNARTDDLNEVFRKSPICEMMRHPQEHGICAECANVATCGGGCRAAALALTGRLDGQDKACPIWQRRASRKAANKNAA